MQYVESATLELKEQVNADFKKEVVAFANSDGGDIYVGVAKDGSIVGIEDTEREMEKIGNMIRDGIKPDLTAYTSISCVTENGKKLIHVSVTRGIRRPYHLSDKGLKPSGVYVRHGVSSVPATDEMIRQMIRESDGVTFDTMRSINQDLTFNYAKWFFEKQKIDFKERNLGLIDVDGYYTNAALLLSDQCWHIIRCAVYDNTRNSNFKTRREFSGSILKQLDDTFAFLMLNNNLRSSIHGLFREDRYDYPEDAVRFSLQCSVVHRDYDYTGSTIINVHSDRMEFISLGGLVKGLTLEDIENGVSQTRNAVIANVFYKLHLIESYGTGIRKIMECYEGCETKPTFKASPASFVTVLPNQNPIVD